MMKRSMQVLGALVLLLTVAFAWGSGAKEEPAAASGVQTKPVVVFFSDQRDSNPDDAERVRQYIIKSSGVDFTVRRTKTSEEFNNQLNIALAGQEDIDLIALADPIKMMELKGRGALQRLNDPISKYGADLRKNISPEAWKIVTDPNGDIWAFPNEGFQNQGPALQVRKDWREKLGMAPISTLGEFEAYLRAVKNGDLDGNGKADTIPLINTDQGYIAYDQTLSSLFTDVISNPSADRTGNYIDSKGNVTPVPMHPGYKEYLRKLAQWHKEGLIFQETYSTQVNQIRDLIAANRAGATAGWYSNTFRTWETLLKTVPTAAYEIILPKSVSGKPYQIKKSNPGSPQLAVTSFSPVADWAVKLVNWLATAKENYVTIKSGVMGQDWEWVNRDANTIKYLVDKTNVNNTYNYAFSFFFHAPWNWRETNPNWLNATYYVAQDQILSLPGFHDPDWFVIYDFKGTPVESTAVDANTLLNEAIVNIIIGKRPVDDWDAVIAQYRKMHGDEFVRVATAQYNKYK